MKRLCPLLLAILVFTGCHAPMPSFNLLAPYGSTTIPPPGTGAASPDTYYQPNRQPSSTPPVGTGFRARGEASSNLSADSSTGAFGVRTASGPDVSGQASRATFQGNLVSPVTLVPSSTVVQTQARSQTVASTSSSRGLPPNVRGMRINEAAAEPARFFPTMQVIDITQLPRTSSVRYANVVPINEAVGTSAGPTSGTSRSSISSSSVAVGGWQRRD